MTSQKIISAFSETQAAQLTGLSVHRLRSWDRAGLFSPQFAAENRRVAYSRIYSFIDIAALRVLSKLIYNYKVSTQHLRAVSKKLGKMDNQAWLRTTLYVHNKKVIFHDPATDQKCEVVSGQYMIKIPLEQVVSSAKQAVAALSQRDEKQIGQVSQHRRIAHNAVVVAGTRVSTKSILEFHEAGYSAKEIKREFPSLTLEDIQAVIAVDQAA